MLSKISTLVKPARHLSSKTVPVSPEVLAYCDLMSSQLPPVLRQLQAETEARLSNSRMMTPAVILNLNMILCRALGARTVLDIGVFTGSSALAAALVTETGAKVIAAEKSGKYLEIARKYWIRAGVMDKIEVRQGDANATLDNLLEEGGAGTVDFTYIDADKASYRDYFSKSLKLTRKGGMIAVDNTLFRGEVMQPGANKTATSIYVFNEFARNHEDVSLCLLPLADGYTIAVKTCQ